MEQEYSKGKFSDSSYLERRAKSSIENILRSFREKMVIEQLGLLKFKNVLEIGCADCQLSSLMMQKFPQARVVALDRSYEFIVHSPALVKKRVVAHTRFLPFKSGSFDVIVMVSTMKHISWIGEAMEEWKRVLAKGGYLIIVEPAWWVLKLGLKLKYFDPKGVYNIWSVKQARKELEKFGFSFARGGYFDLSGDYSLMTKFFVRLFGLFRLNYFMLYQFIIVST